MDGCAYSSLLRHHLLSSIGPRTDPHPSTPSGPWSSIHAHDTPPHTLGTVYIASYLRDALRLFPSPTGKGQAIEAAFRAFQDVRVPHCTAIQVRLFGWFGEGV